MGLCWFAFFFLAVIRITVVRLSWTQANRSIEYLKQSFEASPNASVLAMIATPAAHNPYVMPHWCIPPAALFGTLIVQPFRHARYDPAPQYAANFDGEAGKAPRTANWNVAREGKHWLVGDHMLMGAPEVEFSDLTYRRAQGCAIDC